MPLWRTRALLRTWWAAGACPAALLWAIDHHPDRPDHHRGDALRGANDPLRVLGARLRPWRGRLAELPATLAGVPGDYRAAQATRIAAPAYGAPSAGNTAARVAARAALDEHLAQLRRRRSGTPPAGSPPTGP